MLSMTVYGVVIVAAALALFTQVCVLVIERLYPPSGMMIDVAGARLHVVDLAPANGDLSLPPAVLIHGASANLEALRELGQAISKTRRVILIDRPGHGWSTRNSLADSTPAAQATMISQALQKIGAGTAIIVAHSWAGALGAAMALDHPAQVSGLVLLAPVTHPWETGVAWYHHVAVAPALGWLFANTIEMPIGLMMMAPGARAAFAPQSMPAGYVGQTRIPLLLRPSEFRANGADMVTLRDAVEAMVPRYPLIAVPTIVLHGDIGSDQTVSIDIHSRPFVAAVPGAELKELKGFGHILPTVAIGEIVAAVDKVSMKIVEQN
jgi:pimeloyl-ACP methyl ester carboxylesterase